jgi:hypothetical protein
LCFSPAGILLNVRHCHFSYIPSFSALRFSS